MTFSTQIAASFIVTTLAGCTSAMDHPAEQRWTVSKPLDDTVACVVEQLRQGNKQFIDGYAAVPFAAGIIVPGKAYEVRPTRQLSGPLDTLVVRVSKLSDTQTEILLFATPALMGSFGDTMVKPHIGPCLA